jgi:hypothetical protein
MLSPVAALRCRQIEADDIEAVASLLARGFPVHDRGFWLRAFAQLARHEPPAGLPKYGYLLAMGGEVVGALLLICSTIRTGGAAITRCNLSSWYVDPEFRAYAPMLVARAIRHKDVTYTNVSPAPHTRPIIEAQGFSRYSDGVFVAMTALNGIFGGRKADVLDATKQPHIECDPSEREVLLQHAALGCDSLWCLAGGHASPFVFRPRLVKGRIPCAQLIYCRDVADFVRFAAPIGRFLARQGKFFAVIDANGPIPGLVGWFQRGKMPKYYKGPQRPRLGDLAYTEYALLGV